MSLLSALGAGIPAMKTGAGPAQPMGQDVSTETGGRPPMMAAPPPPHPALAAFPEYTPEQAISMWNNAYKNGPSPQSTPPQTSGGVFSELNRALSGGQR
jgi:hypothetical protein